MISQKLFGDSFRQTLYFISVCEVLGSQIPATPKLITLHSCDFNKSKLQTFTGHVLSGKHGVQMLQMLQAFETHNNPMNYPLLLLDPIRQLKTPVGLTGSGVGCGGTCVQFKVFISSEKRGLLSLSQPGPDSNPGSVIH